MRNEDYMNKIAYELQEFVLTLNDSFIEDFCGFALNGIDKEDAVYQVISQMPDDVILECYEKYVHNENYYIVCYVDTNSNTVWESVYGEDAMQIRVSELIDEFQFGYNGILVFDCNDQL